MTEYDGFYSGAFRRDFLDLRSQGFPRLRRTLDAPPVKPPRGTGYRNHETPKDLTPEEIDQRFNAALKVIREQRRHARAS